MRGLLLALVTIMAVPFLAIILLGSLSERAALIDAAKQQMAGLAAATAEREMALFQQAQETLETLRRMPVVIEGASGCHDALARVVEDHASYNTLGVAARDGTMTCHSLLAERHPISNLDFVRHVLALDATRLAISAPWVGGLTHEHVILAGMPTVDGDHVVFASLRVANLSAALAAAQPPANARLMLVERNHGTIIASRPAADASSGSAIATDLLARLRQALPEGRSLVAPAFGVSGGMVLGVMDMAALAGDQPIVVAGLPYADVLASANWHLARNLAVALAVTLAAACAAWLVADRLMLQPLASIGYAASRLGLGGSEARVAFRGHVPVELAALALTLNATAERLEASAAEIRATHARLVEREAEYRALADNTVDMIFRLDLGFVRRYVSPASRQLLGYAPEELTGRSPEGMVHPEDVARVSEVLRSITAGCEQASVQNRIRHRDGHYVDVEVHLRLLRDGAGAPTGIVGVMRDVTDRVTAERERLISEQRFRLLAENTSDLITLVDGSFRRKWVSPAATALLGFSPEELLGTTPMQTAHPDDRAIVEEALARTATVAPGAVGDVHQYRILRKDGRPVWVEAAARRLIDGRGFVFIVRDVSVRREAEQRLESANRKLHKMSMQDGLTGLANRRYFDEMLETELRRAARERTNLSLVMVDIDMFKQFNDTYGHPAGDSCLRAVAEAARATLRRPGDLAARYGGEELALLLPNTDEPGALVVAERLCESVRAIERDHALSPFGRVTVSAGIGMVAPGAETASPTLLVERADEALYQAKRGGRNRVVSGMAALLEDDFG